MTIRDNARQWLRIHHPENISTDFRASKYYPEKKIWFFTFPATFLSGSRSDFINILLQRESNLSEFYYLKVPYEFFRNHKDLFDLRADGEHFDLHISGKTLNWLQCERSKGVSFARFLT